jgi:hypothetical protein
MTKEIVEKIVIALIALSLGVGIGRIYQYKLDGDEIQSLKSKKLTLEIMLLESEMKDKEERYDENNIRR